MLQGVQGHPDGERERKSRTVNYYAPRLPGSSRWGEREREKEKDAASYRAPRRPVSSRCRQKERERKRDCKLPCSKASSVIQMDRGERGRARLSVTVLQGGHLQQHLVCAGFHTHGHQDAGPGAERRCRPRGAGRVGLCWALQGRLAAKGRLLSPWGGGWRAGAEWFY